MDVFPFVDDESLKKRLLDALVNPMANEVAEQQLYLTKTNELYDSYLERINRIDSANSTSKYINETNWLKKELYDQLENEFPEREDSSIFDYYQRFFEVYDEIFNTLPESEVRVQKLERFKIQSSDSSSIQFQKTFKQLFFFCSKIPVKIGNLFSKEKRVIHYWNHTVPLKGMLDLHIKNELIAGSLIYFEEIQQLKCIARNIKWTINKDINHELAALLDKDEISFDELKLHLQNMAEQNRIQNVIDDFDQKLTLWKEGNRVTLESLITKFGEHLNIVDTIELDANFYSKNTIENKSVTSQNRFKQILNGWRNTQFAQIDDFQIDLELYQLKYNGLTQYYLLENGCKSRVTKTITDFIETIRTEIETVITEIDQAKDAETIKSVLISERIKLKHQLENKSIPNAINALYENNFPNLIERLESKIRAQLELMKVKRIIYSKETYDTPIPKSNLSHFNPKELVEIDLINPLGNKLLLLKTELNGKLENTEVGLKDLPGIVDYNLDSASNSIEGDLSLDEIKGIAKDGLERACARTNNLADELNGISEIISVKLKQELNQLNTALLKLTQTENITNLRLKLAKAKAIEKTDAYRKELFDKIRNFWPIAIRFGQQKWSRLKVYSKDIQERIGLIEASNEMTSELSDFLSQSENAVEQLPYVYRRLYELKPLKEDGFFEARDEEMGKLNEAFSNWKDSKNSSAVIVGEKGSGASSLLNQFVRNHSESNIIRHQLTSTAYTKEAFLKLFDDLFEHNHLPDLESIVQFLKEGSKKIIILEDIQHFYLKKPNGFEAITLLFELISQTAKNIFWLVGTSSFSWNYFQKTIAIERYIKHKIVLKPLSNEQIIKLIMKRHRVSGYNLRFENNEAQRTDLLNAFRKQADDSQDGLKKAFFTELNSFAQSNISLALLYWLRSTLSFEDNTVVIGKIKNIRFDFLTSLDIASIFTLHSLLLHDTLSIKEHSEVFHQAEKQSRMTLMVLEDSGILVSKDGEYIINQLIYRQVINVLKNKNLIH